MQYMEDEYGKALVEPGAGESLEQIEPLNEDIAELFAQRWVRYVDAFGNFDVMLASEVKVGVL